jgi:hypothetical protein
MAESLKEQKLGVSNVLWSCSKSLKTFTNVRSLATYQEQYNIFLLFYTLTEAPENGKELSCSTYANGMNE